MLTGKQSQRKMVIYSVNKARLIDFFDGDQVFSLSDTISKRQENFSALANRTALGAREKTSVPIADTSIFQGRNLLVDFPFVQFFNQKIVVLDDTRCATSGNPPPVPVDVLVLSKSPRVSVAECRARFPFGVVVFDASNTWGQTERWRKECEAAGWACHDVRSMGAWVGDFRPRIPKQEF
jgi:hypothetical protein